MIKIKETIIVEGTYDKIKLAQIVKANIIITCGFAIFKDKNKIELIRKLAKETGIVILVDSDYAGFKIRNYLKQCIPKEYVKHAYIPEIKGVEKRKTIPGKEGLLGVEGIKDSIIEKALIDAGCTINKNNEIEKKENVSSVKLITRVDLYEDGFFGKANSNILREKFLKAINISTKLSTNSLIDILNTLYTYDEYKKLIEKI